MLDLCPEIRAAVPETTIVRDPHPSQAIWAPTTADGKSLLDAAGLEAMHICSSVPSDCAHQLQSMLYSGAAHPWQAKGDGDTALHLAVFSGNEQVGSLAPRSTVSTMVLYNQEDVTRYAAGKHLATCWSFLQCPQPQRPDATSFGSAGALIINIATNDRVWSQAGHTTASAS